MGLDDVAREKKMGTVPSGVHAVVFDAVGTLIHPDPPAPVVYAEVGQRFGSRYGPDEIAKRFAVAFRRQEEHDRSQGWRTSEMREQERWRAIVGDVLDDARDPEACFHELFEHFSRPSAWRCSPEIDPVLKQLATKYRLAIASNYDRRLRSAVAGRPEFRHVSELFISAEIGWRKPAPEFFEAACRELDLLPSQVLYVGDDLMNDYEGARAAGLHAILLDPAGRSLSDVRCIKSLTEMVRD